MSNSNFITLDKKIDELKAITKELDVFSVSNRLFHEMLMFSQSGKKIKLNSPARQVAFLSGVMASQEKIGKKEFTDPEYSRVAKLLNDIFFKYLNAYFPDPKDVSKGIDDFWFQSRKVSMPAFLSYFYESQKIATDEIRRNILETNAGFEKEIFEHFGITHKDMVFITDKIGELLQSNFDSIQDAISKINEKRLEFANCGADKYHDALQEMKEECGALFEVFSSSINKIAIFEFKNITGFSPEVIEKFKELYVIKKGDGEELRYITDDNIIDKSPVTTIEDGRYTIVSLNQLFFAIERRVEGFFKESKCYADRYRRARDKKLEADTKKAFEEILPPNSIILESVFENDKSSNEHDMFIKVGRNILIIEAKAAPRREPLANPSRAFTRIKDDFKRKSGIQSGCDQAFKLKALILENDSTILYDKKGNELYTLNKMDFDKVYCICVTKDEFGLLATDLSILLDKPKEYDYPWVVKITDLRFYFSCLKYIGKDWDYFISYLSKRIELMGCLYSSDELEIAGHHLKYGGFGNIKQGGQVLMLDISESNIFDEIHLAKYEGRDFQLEAQSPDYSQLDRNKIFNRFNKKTKSQRKNKIDQKKARRKNRG